MPINVLKSDFLLWINVFYSKLKKYSMFFNDGCAKHVVIKVSFS